MRLPRPLTWSAIASLLLVGVTPISVEAAATTTQHAVLCPVKQRAPGHNRAPHPARERYYDNDWRLGPSHLPTTGAVARMLRGYQRTRGTWRRPFLKCYWQTNPRSHRSGWWHPSHNGFFLLSGRPIERRIQLRAGQLVDMFGNGRGRRLAPAGTPYAERSLPPSDLDETNPRYPSAYHFYRVTKPFDVESGLSRPWFGQSGLGLQYVTRLPITRLVAAHYLRPVNQQER
jgi:hypothetical protein